MALKTFQGVYSVTEVECLKPGIYSFKFHAPDIAAAAVPGQFLMVKCGDDKFLRRPISICEIDKENGIIRMVFEVRGDGTEWLSHIKVEDTLDITGPLGTGFKLSDKHSRVLLVGGGIGTPPMLSLAKHYGAKAKAFVGFRGESNMCLCDDFATAGTELAIATDDGTVGHHGFVTDILRLELEKGGVDMIYTCGPTPMMRNVAKLAAEFAVPCQVSMEERMACGIGACLTCTCKVNRRGNVSNQTVCTAGPVFMSTEVFE